MSREIKFRALKDDMSDCTFRYGNLTYDSRGNPRIQAQRMNVYTTCLKGTVGQFTGLLDNNGIEIYEGDILRHYPGFGCEWAERTSTVVFENCAFWSDHGSIKFVLNNRDQKLEIIGNIHENPKDIEI